MQTLNEEQTNFLSFISKLIENDGVSIIDFDQNKDLAFDYNKYLTVKLFDKKFKHGSQFRKQLIDYAYSKEFMMFGDYKLKFYKEMTRHEYLIVYVYNSMSDIMLFETKHFQEMTLKKFHDETGVRLFPEKSGNCKIIYQDGFERKMKIKNLNL